MYLKESWKINTKQKKIPKQTYESIECAQKKSLHLGTVLEDSVTHLTSRLIFMFWDCS